MAIQYDPEAVDWYKIDEESLVILAWDSTHQEWSPLDSYVNSNANHVSASIRRLTVYILATHREHVVWLPVIMP